MVCQAFFRFVSLMPIILASEVMMSVDGVLRWWCHHISTCHHYIISFLSTFTHCLSYHYSYTWVQFYQYITIVTLFSRTQSSTLGPRCVISCSDLFTYLPSLWHLVLGCKGDWGTRLQENPQRLGWGSWRDLLHYIYPSVSGLTGSELN